MKLNYDKPKGHRIKYCFMGFSCCMIGWWFNENLKKWEYRSDISVGGYSSHQDCRSLRAFRRKLRKAPKGIKFQLSSRWIGYDVFGYGKGER